MSSNNKNDKKIQKVVFVRHGIARHNVPDPLTGGRPKLEDPNLLDPPLVYQGKQGALALGERLRIWWKTTQLGETVELVMMSPLTRCIQTATLAFLPGDGYTSTSFHQIKEPTFFCTELCREAFGMHYPDKRRPLSILSKHWPILEMDPNMKETDDAWREDTRETINELGHRIASFLELLVQRPETNIVVVTHGVWIEVCFHLHCPQALDHGNRRVYNCDMFAVDCVSKDGKFLRLDHPQQI